MNWGSDAWRFDVPVKPDGLWTTPSDDQASEMELFVLLYAYVRMLKPRLVVETGTWRGFAAAAIGIALRENGFGKLVTCDISAERYDEAVKRCEGLPVEVRTCDSATVTEIEDADFLFIDSGADSRPRELPRMKTGAVAIAHDMKPTNQPRDTVKQFPNHIIFDHSPRGFGLCLK